MPGGHREPGEDILTTAKRVLYEETGTTDFILEPVYVYSVTATRNFNEQETFGMLFYADGKAFDKELRSEIGQIILQDGLPDAWTYPDIQPRLIQEVLKRQEVLSGAASSEPGCCDHAERKQITGIPISTMKEGQP